MSNNAYAIEYVAAGQYRRIEYEPDGDAHVRTEFVHNGTDWIATGSERVTDFEIDGARVTA